MQLRELVHGTACGKHFHGHQYLSEMSSSSNVSLAQTAQMRFARMSHLEVNIVTMYVFDAKVFYKAYSFHGFSIISEVWIKMYVLLFDHHTFGFLCIH